MEISDVSTWVLVVSVLVLTVMSAYFSGSETAMMKLNPYRLRHQAVQEKHRGARNAVKLLRRQDRLLGVILIGNNLVNNCAALASGIIFTRYFGDAGYGIAAVLLTIFILIFAEVTPKTIAAERPESVAFPSSYILRALLKVLNPVVIMVKWCSDLIVKPFKKRLTEPPHNLSLDELRTVLTSEVDLDNKDRQMLLALIDLDRATVEHIMVPRSAVVGIDINDEPIRKQVADLLTTTQHTRLPVFRDSLNDVIGVLHVRRAARFMLNENFVSDDIVREVDSPTFTPDSTRLSAQLVNFQADKNRLSFVVDEYGEVIGLVTLEDIIEEIVGEFTTDIASTKTEIITQSDDSYLVPGSMSVRDINAQLSWNLPEAGAKTMNGLMIDRFEIIPESNASIRINEYVLEALQVGENAIKTARIRKVMGLENNESSNADEIEAPDDDLDDD